MKYNLSLIFFLIGILSVIAQTKVSGLVYDEFDEPVPFANVIYKGSSEGTITDENGRFYLESDGTWDAVIVSFIGYGTLDIPLEKRVNYELKFILKEEAGALDEVVIVSGKQSKKASENPAIRILKKILHIGTLMMQESLQLLLKLNKRLMKLTYSIGMIKLIRLLISGQKKITS